MKTSLFFGFAILSHSLLSGCSSSSPTSSDGSIGGTAGSHATTGGRSNTGDTATSESTKGGAPSVGGASKGGASSGRTTSTAVSSGGQNAGGASDAGGANTGGSTKGGASTGGANTGGTSAGGANTGGSAKGGASTGGTSAGGANTGGSTKGGASTGGSATGGSGTGGGGNVDPHGFAIRKPSLRQVTCAGGTQTIEDQDWICTFNYGTTKGFAYIQSTPVDCVQLMSVVPTGFSSAVAQLSINGQVTSLTNANYDWGGNHHNDMLSFTYAGNGYNYYHSSFGFGWRSCNNMDCLQVSVGANGSVTEDGCTTNRTLPQVCSRIETDGSYADLSKDTFAKCPGDSSS